jgi:hypothetical protein
VGGGGQENDALFGTTQGERATHVKGLLNCAARLQKRRTVKVGSVNKAHGNVGVSISEPRAESDCVCAV